jgi:hypothetical protein
MSTTTYEIPLLVSSNEAAGAFNVNEQHSRFDVELPQPLSIPKMAKNITVSVTNATIWYTSFNVSEELKNNHFYLDVSGDAVYNVTIPDGLYDLKSIAHAVNVGLVNQGVDSNIITFIGDPASQKVVINFTRAGLRVDFTGANSCLEIMGFSNAVHPAAYTTDIYSLYGTTTAYFNTIQYFLIHSDIVSGGIPVNGKSTSVIAQVLIDGPPGSQLIYSPNNPIYIPSQRLAGMNLSRLHFWITLDDGVTQPNLNNEHYSVLLVIKYQL